MSKINEHNYYKWSVSKGDYKRDDDTTASFVKRRQLRKRIKQSLIIVLYLSTVIVISFLLFGKY
jgi:hypothetical protein